MLKVNPIHYTETLAIVNGLSEGEEIISQPLIGAYPGMEINPVNWDTWQLFTLPYSDFVLESAPVNNLREPGKINQIEIMCLSCPSESAPDGPTCPENTDLIVKTDIDFIAFTENESYKP